MIVTRVGPMSVARVSGLLYALMGLIVGGIITLASVAGGAMAPADSPIGIPGMMAFGAAAVFLFPIVYGIFGFVLALVGATVYNAVSHMIGGIEIDTR